MSDNNYSETPGLLDASLSQAAIHAYSAYYDNINCPLNEKPTVEKTIAYKENIKSRLDIINQLLKKGANAQIAIKELKPILTIAFEEEHVESVEHLSKINRVAMSVNKAYWSTDILLIIAIQRAKFGKTHEIILEHLLKIESINPNVIGLKGKPILQVAFEAANVLAIVRLLELGAVKVDIPEGFSVRPHNSALIDYFFKNTPNALELLDQLELKNIDNHSVVNLLQQIIAAGNRWNLQAVVTKGGKALLTAINETGKFKDIRKDFIKYGIDYTARYYSKTGDDELNFIIKSTFYQSEERHSLNYPNIKEKTKTSFKDGKIYDANGEILKDSTEGLLYVISKTGKLYVEPVKSGSHHTYFLKGKQGQELYGFGKPVACGGALTIKNGKITELCGTTGHYTPSPEQIKIAVHYLAKQDVFAQNPVITWYDSESSQNIFADIILSPAVIGEILNSYALVEY